MVGFVYRGLSKACSAVQVLTSDVSSWLLKVSFKKHKQSNFTTLGLQSSLTSQHRYGLILETETHLINTLHPLRSSAKISD
jgi:hypothetical protein